MSLHIFYGPQRTASGWDSKRIKPPIHCYSGNRVWPSSFLWKVPAMHCTRCGRSVCPTSFPRVQSCLPLGSPRTGGGAGSRGHRVPISGLSILFPGLCVLRHATCHLGAPAPSCEAGVMVSLRGLHGTTRVQCCAWGPGCSLQLMWEDQEGRLQSDRRTAA